MRTSALAAASLALLGTSGCGHARTATGKPTKPRSTFVTFHRTGGFVGRDDRVKIFMDRRFTVRSRNRPARHKRLSVKGMSRLRRELDAARLDQPLPGPTGGGCADCSVYEILYRGRRVKVADDTIPDRMRPTVAHLSRLAD